MSKILKAKIKVKNHNDALKLIDKEISAMLDGEKIDAVGDTVWFKVADSSLSLTIVDEDVIKKIKTLIPLVSLHNPAHVASHQIKVAKTPPGHRYF